MPVAVVLIGIPGSGKSTLARALTRPTRFRPPVYHQLISPDRIREWLYGSAIEQGNWGEIQKHVHDEFTKAYNSQHSVIYDATNYKRQYRKDAIAMGKSHGFSPIIGLWIDTPLWLCLVRNRARDRQVPEPIMISMHNCLTLNPPQLSDGFDRLLHRQEIMMRDEK